MSLTSLLDRSLTLERPTLTADGSGGTTRAYASILANVPCAIAPASASVVADYARRDLVVDYLLYTTANLDTLVPGGAKLGDRFSDGVRHYLVKSVKKSANALVTSEVLYQLDCELISV